MQDRSDAAFKPEKAALPNMRRILVVSEKCYSFYLKYVVNMTTCLLQKNFPISLLLGDQMKFSFEKSVELCVIDASSFKKFKPLKAQKYLDIITSIIGPRFMERMTGFEPVRA